MYYFTSRSSFNIWVISGTVSDDGMAYGGVRENLFDDGGALMPSHQNQCMRVTYNYYTSCLVKSWPNGHVLIKTFKADGVSKIKVVQ